MSSYNKEFSKAFEATVRFMIPNEWVIDQGPHDRPVTCENGTLKASYDTHHHAGHLDEVGTHGVIFADIAAKLLKKGINVHAQITTDKGCIILDQHTIEQAHNAKGYHYWRDIYKLNGVLQLEVPDTLDSVVAMKAILRDEVIEAARAHLKAGLGQTNALITKYLGKSEAAETMNQLLAEQGLTKSASQSRKLN